VPHLSARVALGRESGTLALLLLRDSFSLGQGLPDGVPVTRMFFFIAPSPRAHLDLLGQICRAIGRGSLREAVIRGAENDEIFQALAAADEPASGGEGKL
jgi:PTS system nitrogen regulatory IIA component